MSSKKIPLTQGKFALVDEIDYEWAKQYKWHAHGQPRYATRCSRVNGKDALVYMHHEIHERREGVSKPDNLEIDHVDRDSLNNARRNLRLATRAQNVRNTGPVGNTSKYKGVYYESKNKIWRVRIYKNRKRVCLGDFGNEMSAARAYDAAATILYREFAYLNFGNSTQEELLEAENRINGVKKPRRYKHSRFKLKRELASEIRRRALSGDNAKSLAQEYGCSLSLIYHIKNDRAWKGCENG